MDASGGLTLPPLLTAHEPTLANVIGHSTGTLIFGLFLWLVRRGNPLTALAAALAFAWNAASLLVLASMQTGWPGSGFYVTLATSALSLLPAVLLHLSLGGQRPWLARAGYIVSAAAVVMHTVESRVPDQDWHRKALVFITAGFMALTPLSLLGSRRSARPAAAMAIFLFSVTFVHLGAVSPHDSWGIEMLVHHAGVPLALIVLLQDYRFVLLDAYLRVLAGLGLAAMFLFAGMQAAAWAGLQWRVSPNPVRQGAILFLAGTLLVLYGFLGSRLQAALTRLVFGRADLAKPLGELQRLCSVCGDEGEYRRRAYACIAEFFGAAALDPEPEWDRLLRERNPAGPVSAAEFGLHGPAEVLVPIRISDGEVQALGLGPRKGGRRYLSEDLQMLSSLAARTVEHIEHFRAAEMRRLVAQAELKALESQIHPHFLFNALNTLYGIIPREASPARRVVLDLADILRYFLRSGRTYIPLSEELGIIRSYLAIEQLRLGSRLHTEIEVDEAALSLPIPILSVEPLVENAVKHGISKLAQGGTVRLEARVVEAGLQIRVSDTGGGFPAEDGGERGIGLRNVEQRLQLCYGAETALRISSSPAGSSVAFLVPTHRAVEVSA